MAEIYHAVENYSGLYQHLNTAGEVAVQCSTLDLIRCIVTVGNPSFLSIRWIREVGLSRAVVDSVLMKAALVWANLQVTNNRLHQHPIFAGKLSDEKRIISYNLGMAFAKFYASNLLDVHNLVHVEFLKKQGAVTFIDDGVARSREPDLVGQAGDGVWHAFEAKGVSSNHSAQTTALNDAKIQAQRIATSHGEEPGTRSACATLIGTATVFSRISDPLGDKKTEITVDLPAFQKTYFLPFTSALTLSADRRTERLNGVDFELVDVTKGRQRLSIGLERQIFETTMEDRIPAPLDKQKRFSDDRFSVGSDGFIVGYSEN